MPTASELKPLPRKIILYGPAGTGKSAFLYTLGAKLQVAELDKGWSTAMTLQDQWTKDRQKVDIIECYDNVPTSPASFTKLKTCIDNVIRQVQAGTYPFEYFAVDSWSMASTGALRMVLNNSGHFGKNPTLPEWGLALIELENMLYSLRGVNLTVFVIAHDQYKTIKEGEKESTKILINTLGDKFPNTMPTYFDEVWYSKAVMGAGNNRKYLIQTRATDALVARSRASIPEFIEQNEGMLKVMKLIAPEVVVKPAVAPLQVVASVPATAAANKI